MPTIYLVHGQRGEFSDWETWIAAGLTSEAAAILLATQLTEKSKAESAAYNTWHKRFGTRLNKLIEASGLTKPCDYHPGTRLIYSWEKEAEPFRQQALHELSPQPPRPQNYRSTFKALPLELDRVLDEPHRIGRDEP